MSPRFARLMSKMSSVQPVSSRRYLDRYVRCLVKRFGANNLYQTLSMVETHRSRFPHFHEVKSMGIPSVAVSRHSHVDRLLTIFSDLNL